MPAELSSYERQRLKNIAENRKVLEQLGIFKPFRPDKSKVFQKPVKRKRPTESTPRKARKVEENTADQGSNYAQGRRTSRRLKGQVAPSKADVDAALSKAEADGDADYKPKPIKRENQYGAIPGVEVGTYWDMRIDCSRDGIHRPTVAGIHGGEEGCYSVALSGGYEDDLDLGECFTFTGEGVEVGTHWDMRMQCSRDGIHRPPVSGIHGGEEGCYSVALSGGYEDDLDLGECFTFTGEGGRDLKGTKSNPKNLRTAPQSKDQTLTRGNLALSKNVENRNPVRVIRGFKLHSPFAPDEGYRYDGLYTVEKFWFTTGLSGHSVYKFALRRVKDQAPPPWEIKDSEDGSESGYGGSQSDKMEEQMSETNSDATSDMSSSLGSPTKMSGGDGGDTKTKDEDKTENNSQDKDKGLENEDKSAAEDKSTGEDEDETEDKTLGEDKSDKTEEDSKSSSAKDEDGETAD